MSAGILGSCDGKCYFFKSFLYDKFQEQRERFVPKWLYANFAQEIVLTNIYRSHCQKTILWEISPTGGGGQQFYRTLPKLRLGNADMGEVLYFYNLHEIMCISLYELGVY